MSIKINPTVYRGRPENTEGRLPAELAVYDLLDRLGVPYTRLDHEPTPSIEDCGEVEALLGIEICKNLFLCDRRQTQFYLLLMPGRKQFRTRELSHQIGSSRLSFADGRFMEQFLHTAPGSVSALGLLFDTERRVRLLVDREALARPSLGFHPCANTTSLCISTADFLGSVLPALGVEATLVDL